MSARQEDLFAEGAARVGRIEESCGFPLSAIVFSRVLVDFIGYADYGTCHLMEWIVDQFFPGDDGRPRFRGRLTISLELLASAFNLPQDVILDYARRIQRAGLATFRKKSGSLSVEVNWDAVESVAMSYATDNVGREVL